VQNLNQKFEQQSKNHLTFGLAKIQEEFSTTEGDKIA
jgi:hypothetical protein